MSASRRLPPLVLAAALLVAVSACNQQPQRGKGAPKGAPAKSATAAALKPVTIEPAPACDLGPEPASRPRGVVLALYHTANVVGEVEPCG
jgi:hypothetical protein